MQKKVKIYILVLYLFQIIIGCIYVSRFTIPVHSYVDEELYLSMAKSFHYGQGFLQYGSLLNYKSVLYSCIISIAYYMYSPDRILLIIRIINVLIMSSAVFPIYMIAAKMLVDQKHIIITTLVLSIVPELAMTGYIMQEVLYYPLLLWAFYFTFMDIQIEEVTHYSILTPIFYMLAFFTKTVGFIFPIIYVLYLTIKGITSRKINTKILINVVTCLALYIAESIIIYVVNGGVGNNHYASQVTNLFPITFTTIRCFIVGIVIYAACTIVSMGLFAIVIPIIKRSEYNLKNREFLYLIMCFLITSIAEVIILVVYTENRDFLYPAKYLYRYIFPLFVPLFIFLINVKTNICARDCLIAGRVGLASALVLLVYYLVARNNIASGIVDGLLFTTITNIINHVSMYAGIVFAFTLLLLSIALICFGNNTNNIKKKLFGLKMIISIYVLYFMIFDAINFFLLPYYNNTVCLGSKNQDQFIEIAEWINNNKHEQLIYVCSGHEPKNSLWGYIKEDYLLYTYKEYKNACDQGELVDALVVIDKDGDFYIEPDSEKLYYTNDYVITSIRSNL